ncbi:MAG TPA: PKD domain-containing protein [Planctomycetota bacterium]|nr:PKD domain-containing protein [Planctomycetota bacterium]
MYAAENCTGTNYNHGMGKGTLIRFRLDDPKVRETVFSRAPVNTAPFSVSADGTHAGGGFPWSNMSVAVLPDHGWQWYGSGYGGNLAPDNSYRFMHIGFPHTLQQEINTGGVNMYDEGGINRRAIRFDKGGARVARWSNDARFLTVYSGQAIWLGRFNERFDAVEAWAKVNGQNGPLIDPHAWVDPGLGRFTGEAPLTVAFLPPAAGGEWAWDYGDGARDKAAPGKHQYTKPGTYTVAARNGDTTITGFVRVNAHVAPAVAATAQVDATHLWIAFNKRVKLDGAKIEVTGGPAVKSATLNAEASELVITLAAPLEKDATVLLAGVTDVTEASPRLPQSPLAGPTATVAHRAWPANPDRLCYRFANGREPNVFWKTDLVRHDGAPAPSAQRVELQPCDNAGFDRYGVMECAGGWFANVLARYYTLWWVVAQAQELTIEATVQAADLKQGIPGKPAQLLTFSVQGRQGQGPLALTQEGATLRLFFRTKPTAAAENGKLPPAAGHDVVLGNLPDARPHHLMVSYKPGQLVCYLDGKVLSKTHTITGELERQQIDVNWTIPCNYLQYFSLGHNPHGDRASPWRGRLENVALYARFIEIGEAAQNAQVCLKAVAARPAVTPAVVEATLSSASKVPEIDVLNASTSALIVHEYTVDKVVSGTCPARTIRVVHWGWRRYWDAKGPEPLRALPITDMRPQARVVLALDPKDAHPELAGVFTVDTLPAAPDVLLFVENELAGLAAAPERFSALLELLGVKPYVPPGTPTENTSIRSLPAPDKVVIDGKIDDWDFSGGILVCKNVEQQRDTQSAWVHLMHDARNLYVLTRWCDEIPMNNPRDTRKAPDGYNGDSLQFRLLAEPNTPQERCVHLTCWYGKDARDVVEIVYGRKFDRVCPKEERELDDTSQAFARSSDGKGYVQEIAIPWALLTANGERPAAAAATVELNFTDGAGRVSICDLLTAGCVSAGVTGFNNYDKWGTLTFENKRQVAPQAARLADGRTFPVTVGPDGLKVDWKGLSK